MLFRTGNGRPLPVLIVIAGALACNKDAAAPPQPESIQIMGGAVQSAVVGTVLPTALKVLVTDAGGNPVGNVPVTWTVQGDGGSIKAVTDQTTSGGRAEALWTLGTRTGRVTATASVGSVPPVTFVATALPAAAAALRVEPAAPRLGAIGDTLRLQATVLDKYGNVVDKGSVAWSSLDTTVASISSSGLVRSRATGTARLVAQTPGAADTASITITQIVADITITASTSALGIEETAQLSAVATDSNGYEIPAPSPAIAWTSSAASIATVDAAGLVRALSHGVATISATSATVRGEARIAVAPMLTSLSAGGHSCGLSSESRAFCWGANLYGQLGNADATASASMMVVGGDLRFSTISVGAFHTCALNTAGKAYCWGDNSYGALGDGTTADHAAPTAVAGGLTFSAISAGNLFTCGVTTVPELYCWGDNRYGTLGDGTTQRAVPGRVAGVPSPVAISAGAYHTCALSSDGTAYCWGDNTYGELGDSTKTARIGPVAVKGGLKFRTIAASNLGTVALNARTCAISRTGDTYCWGSGAKGQLGDGGTTTRTAPTRVAASPPFTAISVGSDHACGLAADGAAYCWGSNGYGQLGNGTDLSSSTPGAVTGGFAFTTISAGSLHSCGVTTAGFAYCWGQKTANGATATALEPRRVRWTP